MSLELELVRAYRRYLEHLAGKHNQKSHGNRFGSVGDIKANVKRLGGDKAALKSMAKSARRRGIKKDRSINASKIDELEQGAIIGGLEQDGKKIELTKRYDNRYDMTINGQPFGKSIAPSAVKQALDIAEKQGQKPKILSKIKANRSSRKQINLKVKQKAKNKEIRTIDEEIGKEESILARQKFGSKKQQAKKMWRREKIAQLEKKRAQKVKELSSIVNQLNKTND